MESKLIKITELFQLLKIEIPQTLSIFNLNQTLWNEKNAKAYRVMAKRKLKYKMIIYLMMMRS